MAANACGHGPRDAGCSGAKARRIANSPRALANSCRKAWALLAVVRKAIRSRGSQPATFRALCQVAAAWRSSPRISPLKRKMGLAPIVPDCRQNQDGYQLLGQFQLIGDLEELADHFRAMAGNRLPFVETQILTVLGVVGFVDRLEITRNILTRDWSNRSLLTEERIPDLAGSPHNRRQRERSCQVTGSRGKRQTIRRPASPRPRREIQREAAASGSSYSLPHIAIRVPSEMGLSTVLALRTWLYLRFFAFADFEPEDLKVCAPLQSE